ncbi:MAG: hypothetical protein LBN74_07790 [Prevotella sp.]|jgi:hypothetical protein|nr:hypothetical protein [Prevotella sp.]
MNANILHNNIINAIKEKVPKGETITNFLMNILFIGKEAVYRRLQGRVPFTFEELSIISHNLDISLDSITGFAQQQNKSFPLKFTEFVNPMDVNHAQIVKLNEFLNTSRKQTYRESGSSANFFPQTLYIGHKYLTKFYMFKSLYQTNELDSVKSMNDIEITPKLDKIMEQYQKESTYINYSYYIFNNSIFIYLVNDIKYFYSISYITAEDVAALKKDLFDFIDKLEKLAVKGQFDTGNKVQFYLSNVNFESTYTYIQTEDARISHIKTFALNAVISLDESVCEKLKKWIDSLKRLSTLISESGEIQRAKFFKEQRELVNTL